MKKLLLLLLVLMLMGNASAQEVLPFGVNLGGQDAALVEGDILFAHFSKSVAPGAVMSVKDVTGQIIVNIFPADSEGKVEQGAQPAIMLFDASESKSINDNTTQKALDPGWYAANVVCGPIGTSRILFEIK